MVCYLDLVFITGLLIRVDEESALDWTSMLAYLVLAVTIFIPFMTLLYLCSKFDSLTEKANK